MEMLDVTEVERRRILSSLLVSLSFEFQKHS